MTTINEYECSGEPFDESYVDRIVDNFAIAMKHKILINQFKGKPEPIPIPYCIERLEEETNELIDATLHADKTAVLMEAADVACFALFVALNFKGINE